MVTRRKSFVMVEKQSLLIFFCLLVLSSTALCREKLVLHWSFDDSKDINFRYGRRVPRVFTKEAITGTNFRINGLAKYTPGVSGSAMKFDGFSSYVPGVPGAGGDEEEEGLEMPREISIEAWIALGAYPWNWAPILTVGKYKITGFYFGVDSRGRLGFHMSDATSVWHECNSEIDSKTKLGMDLKKWHHVVATYSPQKGSAIYINGELAGTYNNFQFDYGIAYSDMNKGFLIGKNPIDLAPSEPIRDWATYPSRYTFDGIIDEIKVHGKALSA